MVTECRGQTDRIRPLARRAVQTDDIDDQSALLNGWNQTYDQMSPGRFAGSFRDVRVDGLHLFREVTSAALRQNGGLDDDLFAIGIPIALGGPASFCGQACDGSKLHMFSGRNGFEFNSPSGLDIVGVVFSRQAFTAELQEEERAHVARIFASSGLVTAAPEGVRRLRETMLTVLDRVDTENEPSDMMEKHVAQIRRTLHALVADAVLPLSTAEDLSLSRSLQIVRDARDLATREGAAEQPSIEDLCRILGVSRRTLQYSFNKVLGLAPATYLRILRLNGARRHLKTTASVTEAATTWGFWHFGRFASDYRDLFGERPSVTLRRMSKPPHRRPFGTF